MTTNWMTRGLGVFAVALSASLSSEAVFADGDKIDVFVARPDGPGTQTLVGGALLTGDAGTNVLDTTSRIFEADLTILPFEPTGNPVLDDPQTFFYNAEEPGFFNAGDNDPDVGGPGFTNPFQATNPAGTAPLLEDEVVVVETVSLAYWDGVVPVNFVPLTDPLTQPRLEIEPIEDVADVDGFIDDHPDFDFFAPGDPAPTGAGSLPPGGIYLATVTVQLTGADGPGGSDDLLPSDEISILFVTGDEFEDAVEIAERFLIPEPSSALLVLAGLFAAFGRRRAA